MFNVSRTVEVQQGTPQTGTEGGVLVDNFRMEYQALPRVSAQTIFPTITAAGGVRGIDTGCIVRNLTYINPFSSSGVEAGVSSGYAVAGDANSVPDTQLKVYGAISGSTLSAGQKYTKNQQPGVIL